MHRRSLPLLLLVAVAPFAPLHAQSEPSDAPEAPEAAAAEEAPAPAPCSGEAFHQFDFWIGDWDVYGAPGRPPGRNTITALHDGCVIRESYENGRYTGMSMNYYDAEADKWHQLWIDNQGLILPLEGGWNGESMILANDRSRITWTPNEDGSVRQLWEQTEDGETWQTVFDGKYVRRGTGE